MFLLSSSPQIKNGKIIKEKIKHEIPQGMQGFAINTRRTKFADIKVRKALALAMDFEWMNNNLFYGSYTRSNSFFSNSLYAATGLPVGKELEVLEKFRNQLPAEVFTQEFKMPESDGSGYMRSQLLEARKLLEDAGWKIKNGKLTNKQGEVFTINFLTQSGSGFERIIPSFIANLKMLGIESKIKTADTSTYKKLTDDFDYDMIVDSWPAPLSPGNELADYWLSSSADIKGSRNSVGAKSPAIDELVKQIISAKDKETLVANMRAFDRVLLNSYYVIPQWNLPYFRILYWNKFAKPAISPKYDGQFGLYTWWAK